MENFVNKYSKILAESGGHLNYETIAVYINLYNDLSSKEKRFVKEHLSSCPECYKKYNEIFDEDFEFDDKTVFLNFQQIKVDGHRKSYQSDDGNIEILFSEENLKVSLKFLRLPEDLRNQNFRLDTGLEVLRILSAKENELYFFNQNFNLEDIQEISAGILKVYDPGKTISKSGSGRYYLFAAAAAILAMFIIGYFYFLPVEEKVITVKNKTSVDSSFTGGKVKVEENNNNGLKKTEENLIAENQINKEGFKTNPVLDNFINRNVRSEEKDITIITPQINDTLSVPFIFQWKSKLQPALYRIVVVNNKNKTVWVKTSNGDRLSFNGKLENGLYYWKIFSNDQLKAVSKFYIRK
ncbi:MAG: zf-HC2 domain-containing protein [Ignavibacteriaceae bacterium]|jgi:hypothetical protein